MGAFLPSLIVLQIGMLAPQTPMAVREKIAYSIERYCARENRDVAVALAFVESSFRLDVVNQKDVGLFQFNTYWYPKASADPAWQTKEVCRKLKVAPYWHHHSKKKARALVYKRKVKRAVKAIRRIYARN